MTSPAAFIDRTLPPASRGFLPRFMSVRDIGLFLHSARSDAALKRMLEQGESPARALDRLYPENACDPWTSGAPQYFYQRNKYEEIVRLIPAERRFSRALDCVYGTGHLTRRLTSKAAAVVGVDLYSVTVGEARRLSAGYPAARFETVDLLALPKSFDDSFDLVVVVDTLYYLPEANLTPLGLARTASRFARLLSPAGTLLLVNHYFWGLDRDSRLSRRIDDGFRRSAQLRPVRGWRKPFWLATLFERS